MKTLLVIFAALLLFVSVSHADIAPNNGVKKPKKAKGLDTTLSIHLDRNATEARLLIPRSRLKQLRAELDQLEDEPDATAAATGTSRVQMIISGLFLSLAFVFGGVWLSRSGKMATRTGKTLVVAAVMLLSGAFAMIALGNIGPPLEARSINGKMFTEAVHLYGFGSGKIKLEISDDNLVTLVVPNSPREVKSE